MYFSTVAIQVSTVGKTHFFTDSRVAVRRAGAATTALGPLLTGGSQTPHPPLQCAHPSGGASPRLRVVPAVARTAVDPGARAIASQARARVAVLLHCGVMPLNPAVAQVAMDAVVFISYKKEKVFCVVFFFSSKTQILATRGFNSF